MRKSLIIISIILLVIVGIVIGIYYYVMTNSEELVGGDKDEHGCIGSAGYTWNETKQKCVREWEEEMKQDCIALGCPSESIFAGSINSDKYYECNCRWAKSVNEENLICFKNDAEAVNDNRTKSEC